MDLDESLSSRDVIKAELVKAMADQMTDWGLILRSISLLFKSESNKVLIMPPEFSQSMGNLINSSFILGATNELDKQENQKN